MTKISNSVFDIFKTGPGPSSSHTIGPMLAAGRFRKKLSGVTQKNLPVEIHFYGSLALTGKGHGSDRAAAGGLLGMVPETCDTAELAGLLADTGKEYEIVLPHGSALVSGKRTFFHTGKSPYPFANAAVFRAGAIEGTYFSVGGGFIQEPGETPASKDVPFHYDSIGTFERTVETAGLSPLEVLFRNETAASGLSEPEIRSRLDRIIAAMTAAVERGLSAEGTLPGPLKVQRRAKGMFRAAQKARPENAVFLLLDSFALAASEENAAGSRIVTAPTSGSSGILPSLIHYLMEYRSLPRTKIEDGLMTAALFAMTARQNASISGAEVGCQGEVGVASAMGAALLAAAEGDPFSTAACAAEIALEHHLGLSCDPVGGYVQVPCIERNAVGAVTAWNSHLLAGAAPHRAKVTFDEALAAMAETGRMMNLKFRETSLGGLARCAVCR